MWVASIWTYKRISAPQVGLEPKPFGLQTCKVNITYRKGVGYRIRFLALKLSKKNLRST